MRGLIGICRTIFGAACLIDALLAFAWRLTIPAGFMPQHVADGWTITICTGQGPAALTLGKDGKPVPPGQTGSAACPYALLATPLSAVPPLLLALLISFVIISGPRLQPCRLIADTVRWRPPAHAPPLPVS